MGRTLPTTRLLLDTLELEWQDYRRALRAVEQARFDEVWRKARLHASAMANQAPLDPMHGVWLGLLLEHAREISELRAAVRALSRGEPGGLANQKSEGALVEPLRGSPAPPAGRQAASRSGTGGDSSPPDGDASERGGGSSPADPPTFLRSATASGGRHEDGP